MKFNNLKIVTINRKFRRNKFKIDLVLEGFDYSETIKLDKLGNEWPQVEIVSRWVRKMTYNSYNAKKLPKSLRINLNKYINDLPIISDSSLDYRKYYEVYTNVKAEFIYETNKRASFAVLYKKKHKLKPVNQRVISSDSRLKAQHQKFR